jgi:hypothetical protein
MRVNVQVAIRLDRQLLLKCSNGSRLTLRAYNQFGMAECHSTLMTKRRAFIFKYIPQLPPPHLAATVDFSHPMMFHSVESTTTTQTQSTQESTRFQSLMQNGNDLIFDQFGRLVFSSSSNSATNDSSSNATSAALGATTARMCNCDYR